jgi:hypothetical protein
MGTERGAVDAFDGGMAPPTKAAGGGMACGGGGVSACYSLYVCYMLGCTHSNSLATVISGLDDDAVLACRALGMLDPLMLNQMAVSLGLEVALVAREVRLVRGHGRDLVRVHLVLADVGGGLGPVVMRSGVWWCVAGQSGAGWCVGLVMGRELGMGG